MFNKLKRQRFYIKLKYNKKYRNLRTKIMKLAKDIYFSKQLNKASGDSKKVWNLINEQNQNIVSENKDIAN